MVVDTSALLAILRDEPERERFVKALSESPDPIISAGTAVEAGIVAEARFGPEGKLRLDELLRTAGIRVVALDQIQADQAHLAWQRFGRGNHPAGLNFGDCFAYALARQTGRPLLFKGDDFEATDIEPAA